MTNIGISRKKLSRHAIAALILISLVAFFTCTGTASAIGVWKTSSSANENSPTLQVGFSSEEAKAGNSAELTITLKNVSENNGVNAVIGTLVYDHDAFAPISVNDFALANGWQDLKYNPDTGQFVAFRRIDMTYEDAVATLMMTARTDALAGEKSIMLEGVQLADGDKMETSAESIDARIEIIQDSAHDPVVDPTEPSGGDENEGGDSGGDGGDGEGDNGEDNSFSAAAPSIHIGKNANESGSKTESVSDGSNAYQVVNNGSAAGSVDDDNRGLAHAYSNLNVDDNSGTTPTPSKNVLTPNSPFPYAPIVLFSCVVLAGAIAYMVRRRRSNDTAATISMDANANASLHDTRRFFVAIVAVSTCAVAAILGFAVVGAYAAFSGDINNDGKRDYTDVYLLEDHLVAIEKLEGDMLARADVTGDGEVTVADLAWMVKKIESELVYTCDITNIKVAEDCRYSERGDEVELTFDAVTSRGEIIKSVLLEERKYTYTYKEDEEHNNVIDTVTYEVIQTVEHPVEPIDGTMSYRLVATAPDAAGHHEYFITKAVFEDGECDIEIDEEEDKFSVNVLLSQPSFNGWYVVDEGDDAGTVNVSFAIDDPDNTVDVGTLVLTKPDLSATSGADSQDENSIEVGDGYTVDPETGDVQQPIAGTTCYKANISDHYNQDTGRYEFNKIPVEDNVEYNIEISVSYNRYKGIDETDNVGTLNMTGKICNVHEYNFTTDGFTAQGTESKSGRVAKGEAIAITFSSTNDSSYIPEFALVNGVEYPVTKNEGGTYSAVIEGMQTAGSSEIVMTSVTLENGKVFETSNSASVMVLRDAPMLGEGGVAVSEEADTAIVNATIKDSDSTIENVRIVVTDDDDKELFDESVTSYANGVSVSFTPGMTHSVRVKITASIKLVDGDASTEAVLCDSTVAMGPKAKVTSFAFDKQYCEKGAKTTAHFSAETNQSESIAAIRLSSIDYPATLCEDGTYVIEVTAPHAAAVYEFAATQVEFALAEGADAPTYAKVDSSARVEVLKSMSEVLNWSQIGDFANGTITLAFDVLDADGTVTFMKLVLTAGGETIEQEVKPPRNEITLPIAKGVEYQARIIASGDRDSNTLPGCVYADNKFVNTEIASHNVMLIDDSDYGLQISSMETINANGDKQSAFAKGEEICVRFKVSTETVFTPIKAKISGSEHKLGLPDANGFYTVSLGSVDTAQHKELALEEMTFDSGTTLTVASDNVHAKTAVDVLKDKPCSSALEYVHDEGENTVTATFSFTDPDKTLESDGVTVKLVKKEAADKAEVLGYSIDEDTGVYKVQFDAGNSSETYTISVTASYDLAPNGAIASHKVVDELMKEIDISIDNALLLEFKDANKVNLYKAVTAEAAHEVMASSENENGEGEESTDSEEPAAPITTIEGVSSFDLSDLENNMDKYFAKVEFNDHPSLYASIISYATAPNGDFSLKLDYSEAITYTGTAQRDGLWVAYGTNNNGFIEDISLDELRAEVAANPNGTITLTRDYDMSGVSAASVFGAFSGTLDGDGHKIKNLNKPLFTNLTQATVKDLVIEDANVTLQSSTTGVIATNATGSLIENVHMKGLTLATAANNSGAFVGKTDSGTVINKCSNIDAKMTTGFIFTGGLVGWCANSTVSNCKVTGSMAQTASCGGDAGIAGYATGTTISNCVTRVNFVTANSGSALGGIVGQNGTVTYKGNVALCSGKNYGTDESPVTKGYDFVGLKTFSVTKSYALSGAWLNDSNTYNASSGLQHVTSEQVNAALFRDSDQAGFAEDIWTIEDDTSLDKLPTLGELDPEVSKDDSDEEDVATLPAGSWYVPDYGRLVKMKGFNADDMKLYHNLYELASFYDAKQLIKDAEKVPADSPLRSKWLKVTLPMTASGQHLPYLTDTTASSVSKLQLIFADGSNLVLPVTYKNIRADIACYEFAEGSGYDGVSYQYEQYLVDDSSELVQSMIQEVSATDYATELDPITSEADDAYPKDWFNDNISGKSAGASSFVYKWISHTINPAITASNNEYIIQKQREDFVDSGEMMRALYGYSHLGRWYDVEVGSADGSEPRSSKMYDLILCEPELFGKSYAFDDVTDVACAATLAQRKAGATQTYYNQCLASFTGQTNYANFVTFLAQKVGGFANADDWFTKTWGARNILVEIPVINDDGTTNSTIVYRGWSKLQKKSEWVIPVVTLPYRSAYYMSSGVQIHFGATRDYTNNPFNDSNYNTVKNLANQQGNRIKNFYNAVCGFMGSDNWWRCNNYWDFQIDSNWCYHQGASGQTYMRSGTTEPFHHNFNQITGQWAMAQQYGINAYTYMENVGRVYYMGAFLLKNFNCWSHETGHANDSHIFMTGSGHRSGTGAEDYADGHTAQPAGENVYWNLQGDYGATDLLATNRTISRINTRAKLESFFKGMYEAMDVYEYLEMEAFLTLTPQQQAAIASVATEGSKSTKYAPLTVAQAQEWNLTTFDSILEHHIILRPGNTGTATYGNNLYGCLNMFQRRWYPIHYDSGFPDGQQFKRTAFEMLGVFGYQGYKNYYSNASSHDLQAIRRCTGDWSIGWTDWKKSRYQYIEENLANIPYLDWKELYEDAHDALLSDSTRGDRNITKATHLYRITYQNLKHVTNDFYSPVFETKTTDAESEEVVSNVESVHISSADEFKSALSAANLSSRLVKGQSLNFVLDADIDISTGSGEYVIAGNFFGNLNGNGHTITTDRAIFQTVYFGSVQNLKVTGITDYTNQRAAAVALNASYGTFRNITVTDCVIKSAAASGGYAGGILAYGTGQNVINGCSVVNTTVYGKCHVGGICGWGETTQIHGCFVNTGADNKIYSDASSGIVGGIIAEVKTGAVIECYTLGAISGTTGVTGGIAGKGQTNADIYQCHSAAAISGGTNTGGIIGQSTSNNTRIAQCIALGNITGGGKFDNGSTAANSALYYSNYEYADTLGNSTAIRLGTSKVASASYEQVWNEDFYTDTLGWDDELWDFTWVGQDKPPVFKGQSAAGLPKMANHITSIEEFVQIGTDEFPANRAYALTCDLDFTGKQYGDSTSVIMTTFTGTISGNGHTVKGLTIPLFEQMNGSVSNLVLTDINVDTTTTSEPDNAAVIARRSNNGSIYQIRASNVTLKGAANVGIIVGSVAGGTYSLISTDKCQVTATGQKCGSLFGVVAGGTISDVYAGGKVESSASFIGGIVGHLNNGVQSKITHSIANAEVCYTGEGTPTSLGAFAGKIQHVSAGNVVRSEYSAAFGSVNHAQGNRFADFDSGCSVYVLYEDKSEGIIGQFNENKTRAMPPLTSEDASVTVRDDAFWTGTVGLDASVWDVSRAVPTLKFANIEDINAAGLSAASDHLRAASLAA